MYTYITTHNSNGEAIFSDKIPKEQHKLPLAVGELTIVSSSHSFTPDVSTETDIDQYAHDREHGFTHGIGPEGGVATMMLELPPNVVSTPLHRTMTVDTVVVLEGVMELHLDSGEKRTLKPFDTVTQRATMHKWVNVTPDNGKARLLAFTLPIAQPLQIAGRTLGKEMLAE